MCILCRNYVLIVFMMTGDGSQMDWLNRTLTKLWPYIDQVSVGGDL
jgi:hypothetical protein